MSIQKWTKTSLSCVLLSCGFIPNAFAEGPFRFDNYLPDNFSISGETRARYETLDGQFRAGGTGSDQMLLFRTLAHAKLDTGPITFGLELQDSRTYLDDKDSPNSSSITNPLDILQLYAQFQTPGLLGAGSEMDVKIGRQTVSIGSKRQIERVSFANVIKAYTGVHAISKNERGDELHLAYVVPIDRNPADKANDLNDNTLSGDSEEWDRRIWGVHYRRADFIPSIASDVWGEIFVYGLNEDDNNTTATPNRDYIGPGFRLYRKPKSNQWIWMLRVFGEPELAAQPHSQLTQPTLMLTHKCCFPQWDTHLMRLGSLALHSNIITHPVMTIPMMINLTNMNALFGSRRTDLNNTSIHGPLTPANLSAPGARVQVKPNDRWDGTLSLFSSLPCV